MGIKRLKVVMVCPNCMFRDANTICMTCNGTREVEKEIDFEAFAFFVMKEIEGQSDLLHRL